VNHGFMPIVIVSLPTMQFHNYIMTKLEQLKEENKVDRF
jgi:hypothetical protein